MWPFRSKRSHEYSSEQFQLEEDTVVFEPSSKEMKKAQTHTKISPSRGSQIPGCAPQESSSNATQAETSRTFVGSLRVTCGVVVLLVLNAVITIVISIFVVPHIDCVSTFPPLIANLCPSRFAPASPFLPYHRVAFETWSCANPLNPSPMQPNQVATPTVAAHKPSSLLSPLRNSASSADGAKLLSELCHGILGGDGAIWDFTLRYLPHAIRAGYCGTAYLALMDGQECWEFVGERSQVGIRLSNWTRILRVGVESGRTVEESPREVHVWGMLDGAENLRRFSEASEEVRSTVTSRGSGRYVPPSLHDYEFVLLSTPMYSLDNSPFQEFPVFPEFDDLGITFGVVVIQILSNWGGPSTTVCGINIVGT